MDDALRKNLYDLALRSAGRTKKANAYQATQHYLQIAEAELNHASTAPCQEHLFKIRLQRAEAAYLNGETTRASTMADELLKQTLAPMDLNWILSQQKKVNSLLVMILTLKD